MTPGEYYLQIPRDYYVCGEKKARPARGLFAAKSPLFVALAALLLNLVSGAWATDVGASTRPLALEQRVGRLIDQLRSDDAATRQSAAEALTALGSAARPAILKLVKSDDPGLRQQAAQILLNLPWYAPDDPPEVMAALSRYSTADISSRRDVVRQLADLDQNRGLVALLRLLRDDPSPAVQWTIATCLREQGRVESFREIQPPADDSRMLTLCGYSQFATNPAAALNDLRQCAKLELANPTDDDGEFDFVIRVLADEACREKRYDEAAEWRRKECLRGSPPDRSGVQTALIELFALEGLYGPLKGLDADLTLAGKDRDTPKIQYALSVMYGRVNDVKSANAARYVATVESAGRDRSDVGDFLADHGWDDLAEKEYQDFLSRAGDVEQRLNAVNVHFRLANLAIKRGDDETAAQNKERALQMLGMNTLSMVDAQGHRWEVPATAVWAEVYWRYLRAAVAKHDEIQARRRMEQLLELKPTDGDIAIDVVPMLEQRGQNVDSNLLFQWAYDDMKKKLDADPRDPDKLNGIAWLCAECNRKLPEARQWAQQAAALMPNNAAILDTLADTNFRLGRYDEAVRIETQAIQLDPDDAFMRKQVARFRAAAAGATTRPN
ncbi:MAG: HEAT repeat domain-containing protein [Tepidisphaeraceae bacterium]